MRKLLFALSMLSMLAACSSTPTKEQEGAKVEEAKPSVTQQAPTPPAPPPKAVTRPVEPKTVQVNPLKDPSNILSKRSVFFDYDSNIVKDEYKPLITAHAKYLSQNRSAHATVQGNTDERGSREYNLALGQRRADAVKQMMQLLGASPAQVDTVSFGEEKPRAEGHDEGAWAQNRRADIVYQGE